MTLVVYILYMVVRISQAKQKKKRKCALPMAVVCSNCQFRYIQSSYTFTLTITKSQSSNITSYSIHLLSSLIIFKGIKVMASLPFCPVYFTSLGVCINIIQQLLYPKSCNLYTNFSHISSQLKFISFIYFSHLLQPFFFHLILYSLPCDVVVMRLTSEPNGPGSVLIPIIHLGFIGSI